MSAPTEKDVTVFGEEAVSNFAKKRRGTNGSDWCRSPVSEVRKNVLSTGYDEGRVRFHEGMVESTLPGGAPDRIALLRLDTDFYESTRHELVHLYPRLVTGGVLILDDYGHWRGARKAVDEYVRENGLSLLLNRIDFAARIAIKT